MSTGFPLRYIPHNRVWPRVVEKDQMRSKIWCVRSSTALHRLQTTLHPMPVESDAVEVIFTRVLCVPYFRRHRPWDLASGVTPERRSSTGIPLYPFFPMLHVLRIAKHSETGI